LRPLWGRIRGISSEDPKESDGGTDHHQRR
jgi:hypothetical protein